jgi:peptidoglycan hydrolase-like protein with peptidoglycan-binding domain
MRFTGQNKKNLNVRYFLNEADERVDIQGEPMYIKGKRPVDVKGEPLYIRGGLPKVRQLQNLLKVAGLYGKKVDGIVGPETIKAVEQMAGVPAGTTNKQEIICMSPS